MQIVLKTVNKRFEAIYHENAPSIISVKVGDALRGSMLWTSYSQYLNNVFDLLKNIICKKKKYKCTNKKLEVFNIIITHDSFASNS